MCVFLNLSFLTHDTIEQFATILPTTMALHASVTEGLVSFGFLNNICRSYGVAYYSAFPYSNIKIKKKKNAI